MCVENKLYAKGGDMWTGRGLSQGIKHVRSLRRKIAVTWKVKGAYLESLASGTGEEKGPSGMGRQPFSATEAMIYSQ